MSFSMMRLFRPASLRTASEKYKESVRDDAGRAMGRTPKLEGRL